MKTIKDWNIFINEDIQSDEQLNENNNWIKVANALDTLSNKIDKINKFLSNDIKKLDEKLNNIIIKNNLKQ